MFYWIRFKNYLKSVACILKNNINLISLKIDLTVLQVIMLLACGYTNILWYLHHTHTLLT